MPVLAQKQKGQKRPSGKIQWWKDMFTANHALENLMANSYGHNICVCVTEGDEESMNGARVLHDKDIHYVDISIVQWITQRTWSHIYEFEWARAMSLEFVHFQRNSFIITENRTCILTMTFWYKLKWVVWIFTDLKMWDHVKHRKKVFTLAWGGFSGDC